MIIKPKCGMFKGMFSGLGLNRTDKLVGEAPTSYAFEFVQYKAIAGNLSVTFDSGVAAGNLIVLGVKWAGITSGSCTAKDDDAEVPLTIATLNQYVPSGAYNLQIGYLLSATAASRVFTVALPGGGSNPRIEIYEFHPVGGTVSMVDEDATGQGNTGTTANTGQISTTLANSVVLALGQCNAGNLDSPVIAGVASQYVIGANASNEVSATIFTSVQTNIIASWTITNNDEHSSSIIAFQAE